MSTFTFNGPVGQVNHAEGDNNTFTQTSVNFPAADFTALAQAIQRGAADPKKLASLKKELRTLSMRADLPTKAKAKMAQLSRELDAAEDDGDNGKKLWDVLRPYLGDAASLAAIVTLFAEHGPELVQILKNIFMVAA